MLVRLRNWILQSGLSKQLGPSRPKQSNRMVSYSKEFQNRAWDTRRSKRFCHQRYASCKRFTFCQICICDETFVYYADRDACDFMPKISSSTTANPTPTPTPTSAEKRATAMTETSTVATTDRSYNGTSARTAEKKSSSRTLRRSTTKPVTKLSSLSREYTTAYSSTAAVHGKAICVILSSFKNCNLDKYEEGNTSVVMSHRFIAGHRSSGFRTNQWTSLLEVPQKILLMGGYGLFFCSFVLHSFQSI